MPLGSQKLYELQDTINEFCHHKALILHAEAVAERIQNTKDVSDNRSKIFLDDMRRIWGGNDNIDKAVEKHFEFLVTYEMPPLPEDPFNLAIKPRISERHIILARGATAAKEEMLNKPPHNTLCEDCLSMVCVESDDMARKGAVRCNGYREDLSKMCAVSTTGRAWLSRPRIPDELVSVWSSRPKAETMKQRLDWLLAQRK